MQVFSTLDVLRALKVVLPVALFPFVWSIVFLSRLAHGMKKSRSRTFNAWLRAENPHVRSARYGGAKGCSARSARRLVISQATHRNLAASCGGDSRREGGSSQIETSTNALLFLKINQILSVFIAFCFGAKVEKVVIDKDLPGDNLDYEVGAPSFSKSVNSGSGQQMQGPTVGLNGGAIHRGNQAKGGFRAVGAKEMELGSAERGKLGALTGHERVVEEVGDYSGHVGLEKGFLSLFALKLLIFQTISKEHVFVRHVWELSWDIVCQRLQQDNRTLLGIAEKNFYRESGLIEIVVQGPVLSEPIMGQVGICFQFLFCGTFGFKCDLG
ncbi:hypothetical protein CCACVL1_05072 [Corchorus capsularis]|uniref:Uncharacterized protein n=1 Tax=Corchorus capsularis TaxID=210143 RepID=A0A1R3JMQ0_COCAP|nr:hypothetical protein CCACVL1_05072 [Corchorus capsularis]